MFRKIYLKLLYLRYKFAVSRALFSEEISAWDKVDRFSKHIDEVKK